MDNLRELQVIHQDKSYKLSARIRPDPSRLIVFLHGWGGAKECFADAFSSEALKEYGICTIDLLGFGESDKPEDFSYDLPDQAKVVAMAINSLNADKVYLVGHSMGGGIGLLAAERIKNLSSFISAEGNLAVNDRASGEARAAARQSFRLFKSHTLPLLISLLRLHPRPRMRIWAQWYSAASPLALHRSVRSLATWSSSGTLLPCFTALPRKAYIYGAKGKRRKDVVPRLDKSITYEIPASGHALMTDNSDDFYTAIAGIIRDA